MTEYDKKIVYLRKPKVIEITGMSYSTIFRLERAGKFPKRRRLSSNIVAWRSDEIEKWILSLESIESISPK